jgi:hypothetical protein
MITKPILKKKVVTVSTPDVQICRDDAGDAGYYIYTINHWDVVRLFLEYHSISYGPVQIQGKLYLETTSYIKYEFNFLRTFTTWLKGKGLSSSIWLSSVQE